MFRLNAVSTEDHQAQWVGQVLVGQHVIHETPPQPTADDALRLAETTCADVFRKFFEQP